MSLELAAVRLLAPYFGDSAYVWTNVIGVILLALALGAHVGGRLAERRAGSPLQRLLLGAAALAATAPLVAGPLGDWLLPQELPLDAAMPALVRGSFAATVLLFAPPVWLLGAVTPALVVGCVRAGVPTGRAAGAIGAAGTLGSLVGTFATTHWLVPGLGCRATLWLDAALLVAAALVVGRGRGASAIGALVLLSVLLHGGPLRPELAGQELLAERETRYQYLRVVRVPADGEFRARVELKINEGLDSYHSVAVEGTALTSDAPGARPPSSYYDYHALVPLLAGDGGRPADLRALSIGDAAGTFRRVYAAIHPGAVVDGVELDPAAVQLGDRWFPGDRAPGDVVTDVDGRVFLQRTARRWHVIHVDAYSHQVYIPGHLASREFFAAARERLLPGGVVACNVGGLDASDPVLGAIAGTMAAVFGEALALQVPSSRNLLLVARRDAAVAPAALARYDPTSDAARLGAADGAIWSKVVAHAAAARWHRFAPAAEPRQLRDDRPELDELLHRSYVDDRDPRAALAIAGADAAPGAEAAAYAAFAAGDLAGVLDAAGRSREPTPYLRWLCGVTRWRQRQLGAAEAEFEHGLALGPEPALRADLERELEALRAERQPILRAEQAADRNLAISAAAATLVFGAALLLGYRMSRMPAAPSVSVSTAAR
ncbi:MAG: fused MFS/spermidine synthase [Planctomycetota bacterium]